MTHIEPCLRSRLNTVGLVGLVLVAAGLVVSPQVSAQSAQQLEQSRDVRAGELREEAALTQVDHEHATLARSAELTLAEIVSAATFNAPEALMSAARERQTRAYADLADGLTPGVMSWQSSLLDDGFTDKLGVQEIETGLQIGLWRRGEREGVAALAASHSAQSRATQNYLTWLSAGRVRALVSQLQLADAQLARERATAASLDAIAATVAQLVAGGELAEFESLRIEAEQLEQALAVVDAEAAVVDVERDYFVVTGLNVRPAQRLTESVASIEEAEAALADTQHHPLLALLALEQTLAQANAEREAANSISRSTLSLGVRRERAGNLQPTNDTLGIGITLPLGGRRLASATAADAHVQTTQAAVALRKTQRELQQQRHEAEHALSVNREALELSDVRQALAQRRLAMAVAAFEGAESDLESLLRVRRQVDAVERDAEALLLQREALIAQYNQAVGVLP